MIPEAITQLGLAATVLFIVWLIVKTVLSNNRDNDKDNTDLAKSLVTLLSGLSTAITSNTQVLAELKAYISQEKSSTRETLNILKAEILERFGTTDRKIDLVIKLLNEYQQSLDETIPVQPKAGNDGETRL